MSKVKQLWQDEQDRKAQEAIKKFIADGYTREEAEDMAREDQVAEDVANSQFGEGA